MSDSGRDLTNARPFPPLKWDEFFWTGTIVLASWSGFQSRLGPYGAVSSDRATDGTARLMVATPNKEPVTPSPEQAEAMRHLLGNQGAVRDAVLAAILRDYPTMRESYVDDYGYDDEEAEELMPVVTAAEQFRDLLGLSNVYILTVAGDGTAYVGFEFGCTWDEEHGLGVMTHRGRVVEVGQANTSFEGWVAERDSELRG